MYYSTTQAAKMMGISRRRVSELVRTGALEADEVAGRYVINRVALGRFMSQSRTNGRPWDQELSWEIIEALSGNQRTLNARAQKRIEQTNSLDIASQITRLIRVERFEARNLKGIEKKLAVTGESAIEKLGVQLTGNSPVINGYALVENLLSQIDAVPYSDGNLALYNWQDGTFRVHGQTPIALLAINCTTSDNLRVRFAGERALEGMRTRWLAKHTN